MRANELLAEYKIAEHTVGNIHITVDHHFRDRAEQRRVHFQSAAHVLQALHKVEADIKDLDPGQQFWVFDPSRNISLGFRKLMDKNGKIDLLLKTTVAEHNWEGQLPEFYV